jgi:hypothetical protein
MKISNEHLMPITAISALILFALLKKAAVSKSSSKGKNGQFADVAVLVDLVPLEPKADIASSDFCSN